MVITVQNAQTSEMQVSVSNFYYFTNWLINFVCCKMLLKIEFKTNWG